MQKNQDKDKYLVNPNKKEYENLSLNYKNIFISLEIQNLQIDPLIIYKLLRSENCFYMQKTLPGHSAPFETIMGLKSTKIEKINGDPVYIMGTRKPGIVISADGNIKRGVHLVNEGNNNNLPNVFYVKFYSGKSL